MFDHLLESSHRDDSNKWSNIRFGQEIKELASIEIHFTHLIWRSGYKMAPLKRWSASLRKNVYFWQCFSEKSIVLETKKEGKVHAGNTTYTADNHMNSTKPIHVNSMNVNPYKKT